jgi:hypothetical protein
MPRIIGEILSSISPVYFVSVKLASLLAFPKGTPTARSTRAAGDIRGVGVAAQGSRLSDRSLPAALVT